MFCPKCGTKMPEGAEFCQTCGAKAVHMDDIQQPMDSTAPVAGSQQAGAKAPAIAEDTSSSHAPKANNGLRKAAMIGRILMWGSLVMMF